MLISTLILLMSVAAGWPPDAPPGAQLSTAWCSPSTAAAIENLTVNCIGVDPRALSRLNAELSPMEMRLAQKVREANEWAKRYKDLEARLAQGKENGLARQAEECLHQGDLKKAGTILDQILTTGEKQGGLAAADHYNRALAFELQFRFAEALPHLQEAYQDRPEDADYGPEYSTALFRQANFAQAERVTLAVLQNVLQLAKTNPATYQPYAAAMLNKLAKMYIASRQVRMAEAADQEALDLYRQLTKANAAAYQADMAGTLTDLAMTHLRMGRSAESETEIGEAVSINRERWMASPELAGDDLAASLLADAVVQSEVKQASTATCALLVEAQRAAQDWQMKKFAEQRWAACAGH